MGNWEQKQETGILIKPCRSHIFSKQAIALLQGDKRGDYKIVG
jgi:hypothetical protein